jgi:hypothetical protein
MSGLAEAGLETCLFGGWAEELRGLRPAGTHHDVDLLYPAGSFAAAHRFLAGLTEIQGKRFPHKRAYLQNGIMIELFLVQGSPQSGYLTIFWGTVVHRWPADVLGGTVDGLPVASAAALRQYRAGHSRLARPPDEREHRPSREPL